MYVKNSDNYKTQITVNYAFFLIITRMYYTCVISKYTKVCNTL